MTIAKLRLQLLMLTILLFLMTSTNPISGSERSYVLGCNFFENEHIRTIPSNPAEQKMCIGSVSFTLNLKRLTDASFRVEDISEVDIKKLWCLNQVKGTLFHEKQNMIAKIGKKTDSTRQILITHQHLANETYRVDIDRKSRSVKRLSSRLINEFKAIMSFGETASLTRQTQLKVLSGKCYLYRTP